ncbi:MAG: FKBP-type peptidyl-prolyl cis-trans isomerase [Clostridiales bacterium]|nr:FKBP-type peptidyl-prolyl cis-trans isomerase [Clostridiales bacterium]
MKKQIIFAAFCATLVLSACGKKTEEEAVAESTAVETETMTEAETEEEKELPTSKEMGTCALIDYTKAAVQEQKPAEPTDEEIDERINLKLAEAAGDITTRAIEDGDHVTISYYATIGNVPVDNGSSTEYSFIYGEDDAIRAEFAEAIADAFVGEEREAVIVYPENYGITELNGNTVTYHITVKAVMEEPELDDTFISEHSETGASTIAEYMDEIRQELLSEAEDEIRYQAAYDLLDRIINESGFSIDGDFLREIYDDYDADLEEWLEENAMTIEEYMKQYNTTEEAMEKDREDTVLENARYLIAAKKIQEEQNLVLDNEAIKEYWQKVYKSEITDTMIEEMFDGESIAEIRATAALMNYLMDIVNIQYVNEIFELEDLGPVAELQPVEETQESE